MRRENLPRDFARACRLWLGLDDERRRNQVAAENDAQLLGLQLSQHVGNATACIRTPLMSFDGCREKNDNHAECKEAVDPSHGGYRYRRGQNPSPVQPSLRSP